MIAQIARMFSAAVAPLPTPAPGAGGGVQPLLPIPRTQGEWNSQFTSFFGPPNGRVDKTHDRAVAQVYAPPYQGPLDLDRYGGETAQARREYRNLHSSSPVFRAAINGQRDDIAVLEPTITSGNKKNPIANEAVEWLKWTIASAPGGWPGLINNIYLPGSLDGYSVLELKGKLQNWHGQTKWGFAYARPLDTCHIRLQLDVYYNVVGIVNMVRGLEYYQPGDYLLYTHNGLYNSPFGQSDGRAAIESARQISDVYKLWYVALNIYGLPYMFGKTKPQNRELMATALAALRAGGWAVATDKEDSIEIINLASGAAFTGFESFVHTKREDIFFAVRNVTQPFMEGDGGSDAHTDTGVQQGASNAGEKFKAHNVVEAIKSQLVPFLIKPNFQLDESEYPLVKLGGTDWKQNKEIIATISDAVKAGFEIKKSWAMDQIAAEPADPNDPNDRLVSQEEKQQQQQMQQQQQEQAMQSQQQAAQPQPAAPAGQGAQPATPQPEPQLPPAKMSAATFSAASEPAVTEAQVSRVVDRLLQELIA